MKNLTAIFLAALLCLLPFRAEGRKIGYKFSAKETAKEKSKKNNAGSFRVDIKDDQRVSPLKEETGDESEFEDAATYSRDALEFSGSD